MIKSNNNEPIIDDDYWFKWSVDLITNSTERRFKIAEEFRKFIVWLWGIYTASAAIRISFIPASLSTISTVLIVAPIFLLVIVYWTTVWVRMPIRVEFDPRSPTEIKKAYIKIIDTIDYRIRIMFLLSLLSAISVAIAVASS